MVTNEVIGLAQVLWDYHHMSHSLKNSDCILALGSHDLSVAHRAAELYLEGWAPLLIFSGGLGNYTKGRWVTPEADQFAAIAKEKGVPENKIIIENRSGNTGENIQFTKQLLDDLHIFPETFILVQKPYMERRTFATFKKNWPEKEIIVTSPQISFTEYCKDKEKQALEINIMVGDIQRIKEYPTKGFQIPQEIPEYVWGAYEKLVALGFNKHLIKN